MEKLIEEKRFVDVFATLPEKLEGVVGKVLTKDYVVKFEEQETDATGDHVYLFYIEQEALIGVNTNGDMLIYENHSDIDIQEDIERDFNNAGFCVIAT